VPVREEHGDQPDTKDNKDRPWHGRSKHLVEHVDNHVTHDTLRDIPGGVILGYSSEDAL
jgi:hypothetical protein